MFDGLNNGCLEWNVEVKRLYNIQLGMFNRKIKNVNKALEYSELEIEIWG
jgi:hypothetical protein